MKSIYQYIADNLVNEPASYKLKMVIESKLSTISILPNGGTYLSQVADDISVIFSNFKRCIAKNYILIYKYFEDQNIAYITHIFHQTQDYSKIFQN